jgi:hypothetical protein
LAYINSAAKPLCSVILTAGKIQTPRVAFHSGLNGSTLAISLLGCVCRPHRPRMGGFATRKRTAPADRLESDPPGPEMMHLFGGPSRNNSCRKSHAPVSAREPLG